MTRSVTAPRRRRVVSFVIGLVLALVILEIAVRLAEAEGTAALRWYDASTQLRVHEMDRRDDIDVVFAGTSMAWQGLVPSVWTANDADGRSAFNVALAGGVPEVMEPWLLDVVQPKLQPELVVWGLSSLDLSSSYGAENLDRYEDALGARGGALDGLEQFGSEHSALVRYRSVLAHPSEWGGDRGFTAATATLGEDGERRDFLIDSSAVRRRQIESRLVDYRLDPRDIAAIHRTVVGIRDAGADVVLVQMPVPERFVELHPAGAEDLTTARQAISRLGEVLDVEVISATGGFTDLDFVDFTHLNAASAAELTELVAREISGVEPAAVPTGISDAELLAVANDLTAMADLTRSVLTQTGGGPSSSNLWKSSTEYGHTRDLWTYHGEGVNFHTVFIGSSMVYFGFDPAIYNEETGLTAYNAGLPAAGPEEYRAFVDDVILPTMEPQRAIIGLAPRDFNAVGRQRDTCISLLAKYNETRQNREDAFGAIEWFAEIPTENILLGDPISHEPARVGPMHLRYRHGFSMLGDRRAYVSESAKARARKAADLQRRLSHYEFCADRIGTVSSLVANLTEQGIEVIVVALPTSKVATEALPGGRAQSDQIMGETEQAVIGAGASRYIDFMELLTADQLPDHTHTSREGSHILTRALVEALAAG